jgi:hypothetical protein
MAILLQLTCLTLLLGMIYGWGFSYSFDEPFPSTDFDEPSDDFWSEPSTFDDFDKMMAEVRKESQQMSAWSSSFFKNHSDDMKKIQNKLADVTPVCTTTPNSSTTPMTATTLIQNNRRKRFRNTQTTICVKELIGNGTKYIYKDVTVTDDQGAIISQNNGYQSYMINTNSNTTFSKNK